MSTPILETPDTRHSDPQPPARGGPPPRGQGFNPRGLIVSLLINAACPYLIYYALKHWTNVSEMTALVMTGIPSLIDGLVGIVRSRKIDFMAGLTLFSIVVSLVLIAIGGSPRLYLVRESLFTAAFGVAMLISLLFPKPLGFYTGRYFMSGKDPAREKWFDMSYEHSLPFRQMIGAQTIIWGLGTTLEAAIRIYLAFTLPIPRFLIVSPFIFYGYMALTFLVGGLYTRSWKKRQGYDIPSQANDSPDVKIAQDD